jgi:DNA-binding ferritin-like protein (Dps family)
MTMSDAEKGGFISKVIGDKRRWRQYKARVRQLPPSYRTAVDAIERYLMHFGPVDGDSASSVFEDVADLFEQAAADRTPIREIVGEDPVEFVDALVRNYSKGGYVTREQQRLISAIDHAAGENT